MRRTISLDGPWERRDFLDEAWRWSDALRGSEDGSSPDGPPVQAGVSAGWRPGQVPGSTLDDAWRGGEIPNPYVDRNSLAAEWVPARTWLYRRQVGVTRRGEERAVLRFDGLDPGGAVFLDGSPIAEHSGMFVPFEVDVTDRTSGSRAHELVVVVDAAPPMPSQVGRTERARHHRSRMGYGWDFCPRMIQTGIWQSVWLDLFVARIRSTRVAVDLASDHRSAAMMVECAVDGPADRLVARLSTPDGDPVATVETAARDGAARVELTVSEPELWWPNGLGAQPLYTLDLELRGDGTLDRRTLRVGIRSIRMDPTDGAPDGALPYTLVVNDRPTWIRGWNWVPVDAAYGVPRASAVRHLVELARRANVNLLRVWGGGLIESEAFYDACDRAGILVWQEFAQSSSGVSNAPADDTAFVELMRREAEVIVPLRAHHPALAVWCGGNELADADGRPLDDRHPVLAAVNDVVERLDPGRVWLPTSPSGPRFDNTLAAIADDPSSLHDVHGPWEHQGLAEQHELANATTSLLHSEFGAEGVTNPEALAATVTDPDRRTRDRSDPVMAHRGAWWNNEPFVQRAFGGGLDADELFRASAYLQADGLRTLIEGDRRRWPRNAGAIPWQLNESFPNAWSTAAVDYFGVPKAAYHAVAEAYAPLVVGLRVSSQVLYGSGKLTIAPWVANDTAATLRGPLDLLVRDTDGRRLADATLDVAVAANGVANGREVTLELGDAAGVVIVDATFGATTTRRIFSATDSLEPMRRVSRADLDASISDADDGAWSLRLAVTGPSAALEVRLSDARPVGWPGRQGHAYFSGNSATLLPGEERVVVVTWDDVPHEERGIRIDGWNIGARTVARG